MQPHSKTTYAFDARHHVHVRHGVPNGSLMEWDIYSYPLRCARKACSFLTSEALPTNRGLFSWTCGVWKDGGNAVIKVHTVRYNGRKFSFV